jgi:hypothetical protein
MTNIADTIEPKRPDITEVTHHTDTMVATAVRGHLGRAHRRFRTERGSAAARGPGQRADHGGAAKS